MRLPDPLTLKTKPERFIILSHFAQELGARALQEDTFLQEKEECFALADGVGGIPHGDVASQLAVESAIWTYKLTKLKPFYWNDKKLFAGRIFRTANWRVFNKRREQGFEDGMASTLLVLIISDRKFYVYHVGDTLAILYRQGKVLHLTAPDRNGSGAILKALGIDHKGPIPSYTANEILPGDKIILATDGVCDWITDSEWEKQLADALDTQAAIDAKVHTLLALAAKLGSTDNRSLCLISCLPGLVVSVPNFL